MNSRWLLLCNCLHNRVVKPILPMTRRRPGSRARLPTQVSRDPRNTNFLEYRNYKIIYRTAASALEQLRLYMHSRFA